MQENLALPVIIVLVKQYAVQTAFYMSKLRLKLPGNGIKTHDKSGQNQLVCSSRR